MSFGRNRDRNRNPAEYSTETETHIYMLSNFYFWLFQRCQLKKDNVFLPKIIIVTSWTKICFFLKEDLWRGAENFHFDIFFDEKSYFCRKIFNLKFRPKLKWVSADTETWPIPLFRPKPKPKLKFRSFTIWNQIYGICAMVKLMYKCWKLSLAIRKAVFQQSQLI